MHFDDRLATVLAGDVPSGGGAVAQYRQLVDILGQVGAGSADERHALALARIHVLRSMVSEADRLSTVQCLSGRLVSPVVVQYLAAESPAVASAAVRAARLSDDQWARLVPAMPTRARGFLRHRRDLGPRTRALLDQLGLYDTALPDAAAGAAYAADPVADLAPAKAEPAEPEHPEPEAGEPQSIEPGFAEQELGVAVAAEVLGVSSADPDASASQPEIVAAPAEPETGGPQSIGEIVKRIEALQEVRFRQALEDRPSTGIEDWNRLGTTLQPDPPVATEVSAEPAAERPAVEDFQFSTGVDGAISSVSGVALGAVFGLSLALPAMARFRGVDAAVATAFSRRVPVRGGRAHLGSAAGLTGEWRVDADPAFDRASGRFIGYHGTVRRPMAWESAGPQDEGAMLAGRDGLRQIVHELRTPLNAIMGFSEIIEQQLFGPVAAEYRNMALRIRQDARQLLSGFDDLDTALRLDRNAIDDPSGHIDLSEVLARLKGRVQPLIEHSGASLMLDSAPAAVIAMSPQAIDRIVPRLAGALIGSCEPGEVLYLSFAPHADALDMRFTRPLSLTGQDEDALFDVDRVGAGQDTGGPLLGLGFCLRLVRNLLSAQGGELAIEPDALRLTLPCTRISAEAARS
ncbi:histidine kinase dimerization/phospho-acceptor domain-containing protein [Blastomonas sp.]|uniref:sensor histidine kinase n=1 Tax=Blastomonas sp. TaxID=1909299 RepID=UPI00261347CF|nr:histidine kinase dimerization/phospho-acceptor domain-containing protein [Blastomonas sp.]MDM7955648.1 histidine kinase dimerization/phospho-acceptor domain-containing protein [Blastomonas sp.]